jgi:sterol desaturase/sphingolipid hydroxylase (fatty acid hydroxylase superfamily)
MGKNFVSNKDESVRMFRNNFLEALSKVHPVTPLILYGPLIAFFLYRSFQTSEAYLILLCLAGGIFMWTFTEYTLHRFVFHFTPKSSWGQKIHFIFHGVHHDYPNDSRRLVMPPSVSLPLAFFFYNLFLFFLGEIMVYPFFAGFLAGYLFYDLTHYALHHFTFKSRFWLRLKHHHMRHHYQEPGKGFGVSSSFWDILFRTTFSELKKSMRGT